MKTVIEFEMLVPEFGNEFTITISDSLSASEVADILIPLMKRAVVSDVTKHVKEDN